MCTGGRTLRHNQFSRTDSLPNFVTHGAPLRALRARESSAIKERKKKKNEIRWFFNLKTILFHFFHFFNVSLYIIEQDESQTNVGA